MMKKIKCFLLYKLFGVKEINTKESIYNKKLQFKTTVPNEVLDINSWFKHIHQ